MSLSLLEEVITILIQNHSTLISAQSSPHSKLDEVISRLASLETASPNHSSRKTPPRMKLKVPHFNGSNSMSWILKISQFFDYHETPNDECLQVASIYLEGLALSWFQGMFRNDQISSWSTFLQALQMHFVPSFYDDPHRAL